MNQQQAANLLERYISRQCWDVWDHGMTSIADCEAWMPESELDVKTAVEEVLDDLDIDGWPNGGCPHELWQEIVALAKSLAEKHWKEETCKT